MTVFSKKDRPSFVLASASPRRKQLLQKFGFPFRARPANISEAYDDNEAPDQIVQRLAIAKAKTVAANFSGAVILGADTLVVHTDAILGKPEDADQARQILRRLSDSTHRVLTGVALLRTNREGALTDRISITETTSVTFGRLDEAGIRKYVASGKPMDKAGAYGIQDDWGALFVKRIEGDYYNIVGLPLHALYNHLKPFAPELF